MKLEPGPSSAVPFVFHKGCHFENPEQTQSGTTLEGPGSSARPENSWGGISRQMPGPSICTAYVAPGVNPRFFPGRRFVVLIWEPVMVRPANGATDPCLG